MVAHHSRTWWSKGLTFALLGVLVLCLPATNTNLTSRTPPHVLGASTNSGPALLEQARASLRAGAGIASGAIAPRTSDGPASSTPISNSWRDLTADTYPYGGLEPSMAYDPQLGSILLVSGGRTWNYTPVGWEELNLTIQPSPRTAASLTYDPVREEMVLYGGLSDRTPQGNRILNDTWAFTNGSWTNVSSHDPPASRGSVITYDARDGYVLLSNGLTHPGTWIYESGGWSDITNRTGSNPPGRFGAVFVYDARDGYVVLSGGTSAPLDAGCGSCAEYSDTWAFASGQWFNLTSQAGRPPARDQSVAAYDAADGYLFEGPGYDSRVGASGPASTWSFARGHWAAVNLTAGSGVPCARYGASAAFDPALDQVIVFGGSDGDGFGGIGNSCSDTEVYLNSSWNHASGSLSSGQPGQTSGEVMTYDPTDGYVLLFGAGHGSPNETWSFEGGIWTQLHPTSSPSARSNAGLVFDPGDGYVVLFGGSSANGGRVLNDTWTFRGGDWSNITNRSAPAPPATAGFAIGYDSNDGYVLVFGGSPPNNPQEFAWNDTWSFHNGAWTNRTSSIGPPVAEGSVLADDPADGYITLFGGDWGCDGYCPNWVFYNQTWTYRAGIWTNRTSIVAPSARSYEMLTVDPTTGCLILFGGAAWGVVENDTWQFHAGNWTSVHPSESPVGDATRAFASDFADREVVMIGEWWYPDYRTWGFQGAPFFADASVRPMSGPAPLHVTGNSAITGGSGPFSSNWTFGDGSSGTGIPASHLYPTKGQYRVSLNLTDTGGNWTRSDQWVGVQSNLSARIVTTGSTGTAPFNISVLGTFTGGKAPYSSSWTFGDGAPAVNGTSASHVYTDPGTYLVVLTVRDAGNNVTTAVHAVTVAVAPLTDLLTVSPVEGDAPLTVNFSSSASGGLGPYVYNLSFGDGTWSNQPSATHAYSQPGNYSVQMLVSDRFLGVNATDRSVTVYAPPSISAQVSPLVGTAALTVDLSSAHGGGRGPYSTVWTFGDGSSGLFANGSHVFGLPGTYDVSATVTDAFGRSSNSEVFTVKVLASPVPLEVSVSASPDVGTVGDPVQFEASAAGGVAPYAYEWSGLPAGCSSVGTGATLGCVPTRSGSTLVQVKAVDSDGNMASTITTFTVLARVLQASLDVQPLPAPYGSTVNLTVSVRGGISPYTFAWTGEPAGCASLANSVVTCSSVAPGAYTILVTARDADNETVSASGTLVILAPPAVPVQLSGPLPITWFVAGVGVASILVPVTWWIAARHHRRNK